jgi:hypothetical protein
MLQDTIHRKDNAMNGFVQRHAGSVTGMLCGWDRLRFRGTLRVLASVSGLRQFLSCTGHLLKDFGKYALDISRQVREASVAVAESGQRPVVHLNGSPSISKEQQARDIAEREGIDQGLISVLTVVEPCWSYNIRSDRRRGLLELVSDYRKCQHVYHYQIHPIFGFMHARLQTWLPFNIHICINGREWLGRQMDAAGIKYVRRDNCFTHVSDPAGAQALLDQQVTFDWAAELKKVAAAINPSLQRITQGCHIDYYWSLDQSEWASDVMFHERRVLDQLYPGLIRHGMESFGSREVMRFLGRSVKADVQPQFAGQVVSDIRQHPQFYEGIRIKHRVNLNSVKMYNKAASVLRVETTLNNMRDLRAVRIKNGKKVWARMRKGVSDLPRRAEVSQASNQRYLDALAAVSTPLPLKILTDKLSQPVKWKDKQVRGLNLLAPQDATLLQAVGHAEFLISGLRNRDLQRELFATTTDDPIERRRRCGQITRKLRMLRAHGLIRKVPHTHRYLVSDKGRQVIAALHAAREADIEKLSKAA